MDRNGRVVFFLGGQINCSTTIHNRSDIVRVLSISDEAEADDPTLISPPIQPAKNSRGFFKSFRSQSNTKVASRDHEAGMEQDLINRIEKMNLKNQMKMFYSAYSKVLAHLPASPFPTLTHLLLPVPGSNLRRSDRSILFCRCCRHALRRPQSRRRFRRQ